MTANVLLGILASIIAAEVYMWLPALALWMVRRVASQLPRMSERYREEWSADLADLPGHMMKVLYALDLLVGLARLRHELPREKSTDVTVALRGVSATGSVGTVRAEAVTNSTGEVEIHGPVPTSLGLAGGTPQVVIGTVVASRAASSFEGWESTSGLTASHRHHYYGNIGHHPAYGLTVSSVILPLEGTKRESP